MKIREDDRIVLYQLQRLQMSKSEQKEGADAPRLYHGFLYHSHLNAMVSDPLLFTF
jgi:hypothetical protein